MKKMHRGWFLVILVVSVGLLSGCTPQDEREIPGEGEAVSEEDQAIELAKEAYDRVVDEGVDLSDGPCLDDDLMDGWVADIAHDPREEVDNLPENQCPSYGETAEHFVELDENGEVIRVR